MDCRPEVVVRGIVRDGQGRILLVKQSMHQWWSLPGGHLEGNETIAECLARELQEEASWSVVSSRLCAVVEHRYFENCEERIEINLVLESRSNGGLGKIEDGLDFCWVSASELRQVEILPDEVKCFLIEKMEKPNHIFLKLLEK